MIKDKKKNDDLFFNEPSSNEDPQIVDNHNMIKLITQNLKKAASIWNFAFTELYPVDITRAYDVIPETYRDVAQYLSLVAQINAQEFMVQLAVQTGKSPLLTAKLAMGISKTLKDTDCRLMASVGERIYNTISFDFTLYMKIRSDLYKAIAHKYSGKSSKSSQKYGNCIICYKNAVSILQQINFPKNDNGTLSLKVLKRSVEKQLTSCQQLLTQAEQDNNAVYFELVPNADSIPDPEAMFVIKLETYNGCNTCCDYK